MRKKGKQPTQKIKPSEKLTPRGIKKAKETADSLIVWDTGIMDRGGRWSWNGIDPKIWWKNLCPAEKKFSTMKWSEISGKRHHPIKVNRLIQEARTRLNEIEQEDVDVLYSLSVGSKPRIWGIKDRSSFKVLWWDPDHEVCPAIKKHT